MIISKPEGLSVEYCDEHIGNRSESRALGRFTDSFTLHIFALAMMLVGRGQNQRSSWMSVENLAEELSLDDFFFPLPLAWKLNDAGDMNHHNDALDIIEIDILSSRQFLQMWTWHDREISNLVILRLLLADLWLCCLKIEGDIHAAKTSSWG